MAQGTISYQRDIGQVVRRDKIVYLEGWLEYIPMGGDVMQIRYSGPDLPPTLNVVSNGVQIQQVNNMFFVSWLNDSIVRDGDDVLVTLGNQHQQYVTKNNGVIAVTQIFTAESYKDDQLRC